MKLIETSMMAKKRSHSKKSSDKSSSLKRSKSSSKSNKIVKIMSTNQGAFVKDLILYYDYSMNGVVESVKRLAKMQAHHPKEYELFKNLSRDPNLLLNLVDKIPSEEKMLLLEIFMKASSLSQRLNILNDLTVREKEILANDLEKFSKEIRQKFDNLVEK